MSIWQMCIRDRSQRLCIQLVALGHEVGVIAAHLIQQVHGQLFHIQNIILSLIHI